MRILSTIKPSGKVSGIYVRESQNSFPIINKGEYVTFDTYFNCFCYTKYHKYTNIKNIKFLCKFKGTSTVGLYLYDGSDTKLCEKTAENSVLLSVNIEELPETGFLYAKINAISTCEFISGEYFADVQALNAINVCAVFCTYKREAYIEKNLGAIKSYGAKIFNKIYVIDNGQTLDNKAISDDFVEIIPNRNLGGCGGFTRGMLEAKRNNHTHFILMDDDVSFHPEVPERMTVFASILKPEFEKSWISAAMLSVEKSFLQHEMGGYWNGLNIEAINGGPDIRDKKILLDNLESHEPNYGAWWCLLMPVSVISECGLPLPFFIKFDDVEYGLRSRINNSIITMNGIAVSHEDFNSKFSFPLEYYAQRNPLITNAIHLPGQGLKTAAKKLIYACGKQLLMYRYKSVDVILQAYSDFLKGVSLLKNYDEEAYHKQISEMCEKLDPLSEIDGFNEENRIKSVYDSRYYGKKIRFSTAQIITFGGHIIPWFLLKKEPAIIPINADNLTECFMRKRIIQYQPKGDTGIVSKRSFFKFISCGFKIAFMLFKLIFGYNKAKNDFLDHYTELTTELFWTKRL